MTFRNSDRPALLIVGGDSDPNTCRIVDQAHLRGMDYVFWSTDDEAANQIAWDFESPVIDLGDRSICPSAVYLRYNVFAGDPSRNLAVFDTIQSYALAWPQIRILNRETMTDANNKSKNIRLAIECGFQVPQTIVLGDLTPLSRMPNPHTQIIKPLGGGAHTQSVHEVCQDVERVSKMSPQFVQEKIAGDNLRVFSIAGELFCFFLRTDALDYRDDADVEVTEVALPESLKIPTQKLTERIGFDYCALDFRCRKGRTEPVFLEINSFPMFVRFDDAAQNRLADTILKYLVGPRKE